MLMKIKNDTSNKKPLKITLLVVAGALVVAGGYTAYAAYNNTWPFQKSEDSALDEKNMPKANNSIKEKSAEQAKSQENDSKGVGSDAPSQPLPPSDGGKSAVSMDITATSVDSNMLMIRTLIGYVSADGKCTLEMTGPNGATYNATADIQASSSSASCKGFDIPTTSLKSGSWTIKVTFENNDVTGSATKTINI